MTKKILIINGPNLNLLGEREESKYGKITLEEVKKDCKNHAKIIGFEIEFVQSNIEGEIVTMIQKAKGVFECRCNKGYGDALTQMQADPMPHPNTPTKSLAPQLSTTHRTAEHSPRFRSLGVRLQQRADRLGRLEDFVGRHHHPRAVEMEMGHALDREPSPIVGLLEELYDVRVEI